MYVRSRLLLILFLSVGGIFAILTMFLGSRFTIFSSHLVRSSAILKPVPKQLSYRVYCCTIYCRYLYN